MTTSSDEQQQTNPRCNNCHVVITACLLQFGYEDNYCCDSCTHAFPPTRSRAHKLAKDEIRKAILETAGGIPAGPYGSGRTVTYWSDAKFYVTGICLVSIGQADGTDVVHQITGAKDLAYPERPVDIRTKTYLDNHDQFWQQMLEKYDDNSIVVDHNHYRIGPEHSASLPRGHGGRKFTIEFLGTLGDVIMDTVTTTNLWHQGPIPPAWRDRLPDNARFVQ